MFADDLTGYWSAIAQIVPVFALAMVLEARILARRMSRKKAFTRRRVRNAWALWILISWVLMFGAETSALLALAVSDTEPVSLATQVNVVLAGIAVVNGLFLVVFAPVSSLINVALYDLAPSIAFLLPWSAVNRLGRSIRTTLAEMEEGRAKARKIWHSALITAAQAEILRSQTDREARRIQASLSDTPNAAARVDLLRQLSKTEKVASQIDEAIARNEGSVSDVRDLESQLDSQYARTQGYQRRLEELRRGTNKNRQKRMRKLLADATRK